MELGKKIVWFLDGYGNHTSSLVTFKKKSLKTIHFFESKSDL